MIKVSRLTDYATLILCEMVKNNEGIISAQYLSDKTKLGKATVVKLLKLLVKKKLLKSYRGQVGGYQLDRKAHEISVLDIILAVEGDMSLTTCGMKVHNACAYNTGCTVKHGWKKLNKVFLQALRSFTLQDFIDDTIGFQLEKI
jgi:FeS assembly SUF system regulator